MINPRDDEKSLLALLERINVMLPPVAGVTTALLALQTFCLGILKERDLLMSRVELFVDEALNHGTLDDCTYCPTTLFKGGTSCPVSPDGYDSPECRQRLVAWFMGEHDGSTDKVQ